MRKLGILLGIGLIMTLLFGNARAIAQYKKSLDNPVNNDGNEQIICD